MGHWIKCLDFIRRGLYGCTGNSITTGPDSVSIPESTATPTADISGDPRTDTPTESNPVPTTSLIVLIGGVAGGVLGVALLVILALLLLVMFLCVKRSRSKGQFAY